ncbi:class I SAM-dependent methyltransferase [Cyanobium sp. Candia 9D4]|uniref:class I SAM-dependent methyltransferase n=1 Tax=Cyanobium sp. Candia 9D4 TaxID=2823707 RepID=UPI0020CCA6FB|nr:class I SAM-dependent methyltransferase [Cyanobium sp. Candia 9D4]
MAGDASLAQVGIRPQLMPSERVLALHDLHRAYNSFSAFQPELAELLQQGNLLDESVAVSQMLGILEPLTGEHVPPEALQIQGPNYRESLVANGLLSRNRAVLRVLEQTCGSLESLVQLDVYVVEALSSFALWMRRHLGAARLTCSEFLEDAELATSEVLHQDLCALTFPDSCFDVVLCNELFEHLPQLDLAFREIARVLRPGGRLVATCPLAFGQVDSILKARYDPVTHQTELIGDPERHGDPIRPVGGSLVYRIPGWDVLDQLRAAGFAAAQMHHIASWKYGVLGSDLPGVLVIEAKR